MTTKEIIENKLKELGIPYEPGSIGFMITECDYMRMEKLTRWINSGEEDVKFVIFEYAHNKLQIY